MTDPARRRLAVRIAMIALIIAVLLIQAAIVAALVFPEIGWLRWLGF